MQLITMLHLMVTLNTHQSPMLHLMLTLNSSITDLQNLRYTPTNHQCSEVQIHTKRDVQKFRYTPIADVQKFRYTPIAHVQKFRYSGWLPAELPTVWCHADSNNIR
jgi:hypothetical protein